ncbi:MAG: hypothetical protein JWP57_4125, partial [Spirosoma sp.]|nr:hypothetical protein [Spirosoma sp.]
MQRRWPLCLYSICYDFFKVNNNLTTQQILERIALTNQVG